MSDANKVLKQMKENGAKYLDLRFTDPRGKLQHLTMDGTAVDEDLLNAATSLEIFWQICLPIFFNVLEVVYLIYSNIF